MMATTDNEPFGRQQQPVSVRVEGEQIDVDEIIRKFIRVAESAGDNTERRGNLFMIYPRAVND
jgi:hypothetical protein